jgi:hypothetical protein
MLSPAMLERVSASYRRGYYDGYEGRECKDSLPSTGLGDRPFADYDYNQGHHAGANDARWEKKSA